MSEQTRTRLLAVIREAECIGCAKCIQACPVDAILGSAKQMHTVLADECISCKLCLPPCPVDCIDLVPTTAPKPAAALVKRRYTERQKRLQKQEEQQYPSLASPVDSDLYTRNALARIKSKK